jgi:zinc/manganese transport system substrate-binding protein
MFLLVVMASVADAGVNVVATVPTLASVAKEIVGENGKVTSLSVHTQDPHFVDARPNLALDLARADLLLLTGLELELGWLPTLLVGSRNSKIQPGSTGYLDCSQHVRLLQIPTAPVDRSMGDIHPGGNPHYHIDPRAMRSLAPAVAERLAKLDPTNASTYTANAQRFVATLDQKIPQWEAQAASLKGDKVIDFHRSWPYAADWLGFQIVEDIEPKPGIPPTPKHILHVLEVAQTQQVGLILQESWFPSTVSQTVADKSGAKLVVLDAQADFQGGQSYVQHIDELIATLAGGAP